MSVELPASTRSSEALSDTWWQGRPPSAFGRMPDITSQSRLETIPFGEGYLIFDGLLPAWSHDLVMRIGQLGELTRGWDSHGALPVDPRCAESAVRFLLSVLDASIPKPFVVPTVQGGIQFEWHRAGVDLEVEIRSPAGFRVYFADEHTGEESEATLSANLLPLVPLLARLSRSE